MAAAFARRRYRADPRQRPLAGRRLDFESGAEAPRRPPRRRAGAPRDLAVVAGPSGARRYRRQILSALLTRADPRNPLFALHHAGYSRWRAAAAGADRALLRLTLPRQPVAAHPRRYAKTLRRTAAANTSRWRAHLAQSRCADRTIDRPAAAAADLRRPQHCAAAGAIECDRPHDADVALLPPRRWQFRDVQRHEQRAIGFAGDPARL